MSQQAAVLQEWLLHSGCHLRCSQIWAAKLYFTSTNGFLYGFWHGRLTVQVHCGCCCWWNSAPSYYSSELCVWKHWHHSFSKKLPAPLLLRKGGSYFLNVCFTIKSQFFLSKYQETLCMLASSWTHYGLQGETEQRQLCFNTNTCWFICDTSAVGHKMTGSLKHKQITVHRKVKV